MWITSTADTAHSLHNPVARVSQTINAARIIAFHQCALPGNTRDKQVGYMPLAGDKNNLPHFRPDGTFRVMQFADIQDVAPVSPDSLALMAAALDAERPDLVVLTGDQVKGYALAFRHKSPQEAESLTRRTIEQVCSPMVSRGIPFVVTYGNHDRQCGLDNTAQEAFYRAQPGCLNATAWAELCPGTLCLPILASNESGDARLAIWLADSGAGDIGGGYEAFPTETLDWLTGTADRLAAEKDHPVPGILFQHIPLPQVYECLRPARAGEKGIPGYRAHYTPHLKLVCAEDYLESGTLREPVCCPDADSGEFDALSEQGSFLGVFFGHDHKNTLVTRYRGMRLGYAPTAGFGSYGPSVERAARVFTFTENDPASFETHLLDYRTLVSAEAPHPLRDKISSTTPVTAEEAREAFRTPALIACVAATTALACRLIHSITKRR